MEQPKLIEVSVSASTGGKMQLVKFEISSDFHFSMSGKWSIPENMSDEDAELFRNEQILRLRSEIESVAQAEVDALMEQKNGYIG